MMNYPLLLKTILYRAYTVFPEKEIVSRSDMGIFRYTYADMHRRVCQLANVLGKLGVQPDEHVGSFAWNHHRHLELYFAVPCAARVLHTINIRLFRDQLIHTINHAEDRFIFVDPDLIPVLESIQDSLKTVEGYVVLTDQKELPPTTLKPVYHYEELLAQTTDVYEFPDMDEWKTAILGYTSATTGMPKGVEYSHRGLFLHCLMELSGALGVDEEDVTMPIVPMFHVNAWGCPYAHSWVGAKQVYPGARPTLKDYADMIQDEQVTFSAGVPTVWMGILNFILQHPERYDFKSVKRLLSGGSALPEALIEAYQQKLGISMYQGYGQTETTPITFISYPKRRDQLLSPEQHRKVISKTGLLVPGLEMRIVDGTGQDVLHDGLSMGELLLKGPWVLKEYYKNPEKTSEAFMDGWFRTGDIVTMDTHGYLQIVDRTRDLIKSGGEWISSVDLENTLMSHPQIAEAAVIAIPHEKWQERPLACVVLKPNSTVTKTQLQSFMSERVAKWWLPDDYVFVAEIPKTSVGKFSKKTLREQFIQGQQS